MRITSRRAAVALSAFALLSFSPQARADIFSQITALGGTDANTFGILYEGGGSNQQLAYNNSNETGNVGIGGTGQLAMSSGTITGNVEFANAVNTNSSGGTITGMTTGSNANVANDLTAVNQLSQSLAGETAATSLLINNANVSVTLNASQLDASGNYVINTTLQNFSNGTTLTINGDGNPNHNVVFNIAATSAGFNGTVILNNIAASQVLFNFTAGNYSTLSGGSTLTISGGNSNTQYGIFLDPNGSFQVNATTVNGWVFGGDTTGSSFKSGANLTVPTVFVSSSVPEPATSTIVLVSLVPLGIMGLRRLCRRRSE